MTCSEAAINPVLNPKVEASVLADRCRLICEPKPFSRETESELDTTSRFSREYGKSPYMSGPGSREQLEKLIISDLKGLGLTERESEVYISLSKRKTMKAGDLSRQVRLHKAQVYRILKNLGEKGLVDSTLEVPARFTAVPLERYLNLSIKARIEDAKYLDQYKDEMLSRWRCMDSTVSEVPLQRFQIVAGRGNIYARILEMIDDADVEVSVLTTSEVVAQSLEADVTDAIFRRAKRNKDIKFRLLTSVAGDKVTRAGGGLEEFRLRQLLNVEERNMVVETEFLSRFVIKDEEAIVFVNSPNIANADKQEETALWTNSDSVTRILRMFFEELWRDATAQDKRLCELGPKQPVST